MQGYTRRQLKEDKFAETTQGALEWAADHRRSLTLTIGLVVIVALATTFFLMWQSRNNERSSAEFGAALRTYTAPIGPAGAPGQSEATFPTIADRAKQAEKEFKFVADKYPYANAGRMSRYMEGVAAMQAGDNATAEKELKAAAGFSNKEISSLAKMALASLYRFTNKQADAARLYNDLADHPSDTVSKPAAELEMAEMYETTDPQQAISLYQKIQKENPNSPAAQVAASKLAKSQSR